MNLYENPSFKFVTTVFAPYTGSREYTYKTLLDLETEDYVVVQTPNGEYKVVQVRTVCEPDEIELNPDIKYKWVIQKLEFEHYDAVLEKEASITDTIFKLTRL